MRNSTESLIYRNSIAATVLKKSLEESVAWDLDAIKRTALSITRLGQMAEEDMLDLASDSDAQTGLMNLYSWAAKITDRLGQMELYSNHDISNSYTANWIKSHIGEPDLKGVWLRFNNTALLIKDVVNSESNTCIDLMKELPGSEARMIQALNQKVLELIEIRNEALLKLNNAIKEAETTYIAVAMSEKISINYDVVEDMLGRDPNLKKQFDLSRIEPLPAAIEFQDLYAAPHKFINNESKITISGNPPIVSMIIEPKGKIYMGFSSQNIFGVPDAEKEICIKKAGEIFARQIITKCRLSENHEINLRMDCIQLLSQNFCSSIKVTATAESVVVSPYGFDQSEVSKAVALKLLEIVKETKPETYAKLNGMCEAISVSAGEVDPRAALSLAYEIDSSTETVFSNYPISESTRDKIALYKSIRENCSHIAPKAAERGMSI